MIALRDQFDDRPAGTPSIAVLYENDAWMGDLFTALDARGVAYSAIDVSADAMDARVPDHALVINRVSPSAGSRGHGHAIDLAHDWLETLDRRGTRVLNGAGSFLLETSKLAQYRLIEELGLNVPTTIALEHPDDVDRIDESFPFPAMLKPDTGGSGAGVRFVGSRRELERLLDEDPRLFAGHGTHVLQQFVSAPDGGIMRMEFVGDELLFAMRVLPVNTYNLCPADGCERDPADGNAPADAIFTHVADVPEDALAEARGIVRAAGLDIGGVEYIETADGTRYFFDINSTSVYRSEIVTTSGVPAIDRLVSYIEREAATATATNRALAA